MVVGFDWGRHQGPSVPACQRCRSIFWCASQGPKWSLEANHIEQGLEGKLDSANGRCSGYLPLSMGIFQSCYPIQALLDGMGFAHASFGKVCVSEIYILILIGPLAPSVPAMIATCSWTMNFLLRIFFSACRVWTLRVFETDFGYSWSLFTLLQERACLPGQAMFLARSLEEGLLLGHRKPKLQHQYFCSCRTFCWLQVDAALVDAASRSVRAARELKRSSPRLPHTSWRGSRSPGGDEEVRRLRARAILSLLERACKGPGHPDRQEFRKSAGFAWNKANVRIQDMDQNARFISDLWKRFLVDEEEDCRVNHGVNSKRRFGSSMKIHELNYENIPVIEDGRASVQGCDQLKRRVLFCA